MSSYIYVCVEDKSINKQYERIIHKELIENLGCSVSLWGTAASIPVTIKLPKSLYVCNFKKEPVELKRHIAKFFTDLQIPCNIMVIGSEEWSQDDNSSAINKELTKKTADVDSDIETNRIT